MSETVSSLEESRLRRSPDALATQVDGDIMMLVLSTGMYHSLSGVAARWRRPPPPVSYRRASPTNTAYRWTGVVPTRMRSSPT